MQSICSQSALSACPHRHKVPVTRLTVPAAGKKGFGGSTKQAKPEQKPAEDAAAEPVAPPVASVSTSAPAAVDKQEEIEAMLRRRKNRSRVEPQVKVQSAAVDMATGKAPTTPVGEAETRVVQVLGIFFFVLLTEGLVLAGSGFLPSEWDPFFRDVLYPSFSPQMLLFLGMSSAYGLWKTGKLPGQKQIK